MRSAFVAHHEDPHPLASSIALLQDGAVAVAAKHAAPHERLVVDEYHQLADGNYALQQTATEIFRWVRDTRGFSDDRCSWLIPECRTSKRMQALAAYAEVIANACMRWASCQPRLPYLASPMHEISLTFECE